MNLLTVGDAARVAGVKTTTIYAWIQRGKLVSIRFGRGVMIPAPALENFLAEKRRPSKQLAPEPQS
jgi:excisionase family DNA binding protein